MLKFKSFGFSALRIYSLGSKPGSDLAEFKFLSFDIVPESETLYFFILLKVSLITFFHSEF